MGGWLIVIYNTMTKLKLGIDATNIRAGGGVTHLAELLGMAEPEKFGFSKVIIWSVKSTLNKIEDRPWLEKVHLSVFEKNLVFRVLWQRFYLSKLALYSGCSVIFVPGGSFAGKFQPFVTMSQNMLPFDWHELRRYGLSLFTIKLLLLRHIQVCTFKNADGVIFLTKYAQSAISDVVKETLKNIVVIPHGINSRFIKSPRFQNDITEYSLTQPFRIIYISIVDLYKHQWHVAEAVSILRNKGIPIELLLVGPSTPMSFKLLQNSLKRLDPFNEYIHYIGSVPYEKLHEQYDKADLCLFASSCENMPNILLEGMASGLPICCSNKGPMPEVLGEGGLYFDPEKPEEIANTLLNMINSPQLRNKLAETAFNRVHKYSWKLCADQTFEFLKNVAMNYNL